MHYMKHDHWAGKPISPVSITGGMTVTELVDDVFDGMGYNAKRLAEACHLFKTMIDDNSTVCLTLAGAMSPVGMGGGIIKMIENGFIDWIVTTGANTYHDLHFAYGQPHVRPRAMELDRRIGEDPAYFDWDLVRAGLRYRMLSEVIPTQVGGGHPQEVAHPAGGHLRRDRGVALE